MTPYARRIVAQWDWRATALAFALIGAEAMLVSLVVGLLETPGTIATGEIATGINPVAILVVMLVAAAAPKVAETLQIWSPEYEIFIAGSILVTLVGMVYACAFFRYAPWDPAWLREALHAFTMHETTAATSVWLITFVIIYAWVRGRLREPPALDNTYTMLRVGIIVVAITSVLTTTGQDARSPGQQYVRPLMLAFFFFALSAITLARLQMEGLRAQGRLGPQWLGPLIAPVALVLILGLLVAGLLSHQFLAVILGLLSPVFAVLNWILAVIIAVISYIAYFVYLILSLIIAKLAGGARAQPPQIRQPPQQIIDQANQHVAKLPDGVRIILLLLVAGIVLALLSRFLFRKPVKRQRGNEERESVMDWNDLGAGLKNALANLANRFRRNGNDPWAHLRGDPRLAHTLKIRIIYTRLLQRGSRAGAPRPPAAAPREHVPALRGVFPQKDPDVAALTDLYRAARYDDHPATATQADEAERAYRAITEQQKPL